MLRNNAQITAHVTAWLHRRRIPYIFTSSALAAVAKESAYGAAKLASEAAVGCAGRVVRLFNVFGPEYRYGLRGHVLTHWLAQCIRVRARSARVDTPYAALVPSISNGRETRRFAHANATAAALMRAMDRLDRLPRIAYLGGGRWLTLRHLGALVERATDGACRVSFRASLDLTARATRIRRAAKCRPGNGCVAELPPSDAESSHRSRRELIAAISALHRFYVHDMGPVLRVASDTAREPRVSLIWFVQPAWLRSAVLRRIAHQCRSLNVDLDLIITSAVGNGSTIAMPKPARRAGLRWLLARTRVLSDVDVDRDDDPLRWARGAFVALSSSPGWFDEPLLMDLLSTRATHPAFVYYLAGRDGAQTIVVSRAALLTTRRGTLAARLCQLSQHAPILNASHTAVAVAEERTILCRTR